MVAVKNCPGLLRSKSEDRSDVSLVGETARGGLRVWRAAGETKLVGESHPHRLFVKLDKNRQSVRRFH